MNYAKKCKELRMKKATTQEQMEIALNVSSQSFLYHKPQLYDIIKKKQA